LKMGMALARSFCLIIISPDQTHALLNTPRDPENATHYRNMCRALIFPARPHGVSILLRPCLKEWKHHSFSSMFGSVE